MIGEKEFHVNTSNLSASNCNKKKSKSNNSFINGLFDVSYCFNFLIGFLIYTLIKKL